MPVHYKGFNFAPGASVVRSPRDDKYGSKRSSGHNALSGLPYPDEIFYSSYAISFSSEQTAAFTIREFYVTIFNISNPTVAPSQSATLTLTLLDVTDGFYPNTVSISIPVAEEMYKVNVSAVTSITDTYAVLFQASFDDSSEAGVIIDGLRFERSHYQGLSNKCHAGIRTLTFDDINTSCGKGDIAAPPTYHDFHLHYPTSAYEELSPWNITAVSLYAANSSEALVAGGSRNILYGTTGTNGPSAESEFHMDGQSSLLLDETHSFKSAGDFDFDLISLRLGMDEIQTVSGADAFILTIQGSDKCGNQVAQMVRYYLPFPGTGGGVTHFLPGIFAELNFVGLRKVEFFLTAEVLVDGDFPVTFNLPFWIDDVKYRRSGLEDSCPKKNGHEHFWQA
ncbi:hypothetical protein V1515DRAFT_535634 [Lipomyces mesembrius]